MQKTEGERREIFLREFEEVEESDVIKWKDVREKLLAAIWRK